MEQAPVKHRLCVWFPCLALVCIVAVLPTSAQTHRTMSWEEYSRTSYRWPYVVTIYTPHGSLFYFGVQHTDDPCDEQLREIEMFWMQFDPDAAFYEGPDRPFAENTRSQAVRNAGESGLVRYLAGSHLTVNSMEPKLSDEIAELLKKYKPEQVKIFYIMRDMVAHDRLKFPTESRQEYLQAEMTRYSPEPALKNTSPMTISELQATFAKYFPDLGPYKDAPVWVDPASVGTVLNDISRASTEYRDEYMVSLLSRTVCEQKRVFAVVGASHVVRQEPAIRAFLAENCSK